MDRLELCLLIIGFLLVDKSWAPPDSQVDYTLRNYAQRSTFETWTRVLPFTGLVMTKAQLKNSGKLMKNSCMPKNQVTEDMVGEIETGKFIEDRNVMCYIACVYQMGGTVKNGKLNYEASIKQIDLMFPPEIKEQTKKAAESCKDVTKKYKDLCEASYWTAKCMYEANPKIFFFP